MVAHTRKSGIRKKVYENDEMMDIFVAHAKFDGGYDFDRSSSEIECKLHDGYSSNDHKWNDARLYMKLVGVDHYVMGIDFNGNNFQTAEQLIDNGNGETIGDTMSELLSYAQFYGTSQSRWSATKSKSFNSMVKQRRCSIKKSDGEWAPICRDIMAELDQISSGGRCVLNDVMEGGMENSCPQDSSYAIFDALDHLGSELRENGCEEDSEHIENVYALIQKERGLMALVAQRIDEWYDFESFYTMFEDIINEGY